MKQERTRNRHLSRLHEAKSKKADIDLAVTKCLSKSPLRPEELRGLMEVSQAELISDYNLDLYMVEQVKLHTMHEQNRLRAQNMFTRSEETEGLYPNIPYTRTSPIKESKNRNANRLAECGDWEGGEEGRMLDYGEAMSDSDEGRMARAAFKSIADNAQDLYDALHDADDIPSWCEYYAAEAQHIMQVLKRYLTYKIDNPEGGNKMKHPLMDKTSHGEY